MSVAGRPWAEVRNELFGTPYMVWHDGPEFSGLRAAWREEPEAVLEQLFAGMAEGDSLAAQSLSELQPAPTGEVADRVIASLREHLPGAPASSRVQIGLTLYKLTGDTAWAEPIVTVLDGVVHWGDRIDAAIALREVPPSTELRAALLRNVATDDYLVRYHSATTVLRWAGVDRELSDADHDLFALVAKDDDAAAWARAAAEIDERYPISSGNTRL